MSTVLFMGLKTEMLDYIGRHRFTFRISATFGNEQIHSSVRKENHGDDNNSVRVNLNAIVKLREICSEVSNKL